MNIKQALAAFETKSAVATFLAAGLDGHRVNTTDVAATLQVIVSAADTGKGGGADIAAIVSAFPVAIAGQGAATVDDLIQGTVALPPAGDLGYTVSMIGVRGIEVSVTDEAGKAATEKRNGVISLAIYPAYSVAALLTTDEGKAHLEAIAAKEFGLTAFRRLRFTPGEATIGDLTEAALGMPVAMSDFTDRRRATGADTFAAFNDLWPDFLLMLRANPAQAALANALPKKSEMLLCIRSKAYALAKYPAFETANTIVRAARAFAARMTAIGAKAAEEGETFDYDMGAIERWIAGRDELDLFNRVDAISDDVAATDLSDFGV